MARTVARDPVDPSVPLWLGQGKRAMGLRVLGATEGLSEQEIAQRIRNELGLDPRKARLFEQAFRFLVMFYNGLLSTGKVKASFGAVDDLMKLRRLEPALADQLAPEVLGGEIKASELRVVLDDVLSSAAASPAKRGLDAKRRTQAFERLAINRFLSDPAQLGLGPVDEIWEPERGKALMPDLIVDQGDRKIAIEVRAAGLTVKLHEVGAYLARLAQLEQVFDRAILVLPLECVELAETALRLQKEWDGRELKIILLDSSTPDGEVQVFDH